MNCIILLSTYFVRLYESSFQWYWNIINVRCNGAVGLFLLILMQFPNTSRSSFLKLETYAATFTLSSSATTSKIGWWWKSDAHDAFAQVTYKRRTLYPITRKIREEGLYKMIGIIGKKFDMEQSRLKKKFGACRDYSIHGLISCLTRSPKQGQKLVSIQIRAR